VASSASQARAREVLTEAAKKCGREPKLDLISFDADAACYRLSALCDSLDARRVLAETTLDDLIAAGIALGRGSRSVGE